MSKTKSVSCYGGPLLDRPDPRREIWVYDAALSLLLAQVIRMVETTASRRRPAWWAHREDDLRVQAAVSDLFFELDDGLTVEQREEFAQLLEHAADRLSEREPFTMEEAAAWKVHGDETVIFRGTQPQATGPVAELGRVLAALLRGPLPAPPPGVLWFYGGPEGRSTIAMANLAGGGEQPQRRHDKAW